jgi:hypothetical protein
VCCHSSSSSSAKPTATPTPTAAPTPAALANNYSHRKHSTTQNLPITKPTLKNLLH